MTHAGTILRSDPEGILEATIIAWALEDAETAASYFAEDADFQLFTPKDIWPFSGKYRGRAAIQKRLQNILSGFHVDRFSPRTILSHDDELRTQIDFTFRHRASGQTIDGVMRVIAEIKNGKIVRWHEYQDLDRVEAFMRLVNSEE